MAKKTIEQAKIELAKIEKAVSSLKSMDVEVPENMLKEYEALLKIVNGNASANLASTLNEKISPAINKSQEYAAHLAKLVGNGVKVTVKAVTAEDGTVTISFDAASSGGGQKAGTSTNGGTKASTAHNNYKVTVTGAEGYPQTEATFSTASAAVGFIINNGKNPFNLPAGYGKGNSMVRVLDGLEKHEAFAANFTVERSYVASAPKAEAPAAETTAPAAE